jgi:hypothetical protein
MKNAAFPLLVASAIQNVGLAAPAGLDEPMTRRLENGLGRTPALGYNNWVLILFEWIIASLTNRTIRTMEAAHTLPQTRH